MATWLMRLRGDVFVFVVGGNVEAGTILGIVTQGDEVFKVRHAGIAPPVVEALLEDIAGMPHERVTNIPLRSFRNTVPPSYVARMRDLEVLERRLASDL